MKAHKNIYTFTFLLLLIWSWQVDNLYAQETIFSGLKSDQQRAKEYFEANMFEQAVEVYKKLLSSQLDNDELKLKLALCHLRMNNADEAVHWFGKITKPAVMDQHAYDYAQVLCKSGRYQDARYWYGYYSSINPSDTRPKAKIKAIDNLKDLNADSAAYLVSKIGINSQFSDFSPAFYQNGIVFVSSRPKHAIFKHKNGEEGNFDNLYFAQKKSHDNLTEAPEFAKPEVFDKKLSTSLHEGPLTVFPGDQKIIFTRSAGAKEKNSNGKIPLYLYTSEFINGQWSDPKSLNINVKGFSMAHPSLSTDGKTLYFSSDIPGGYGGMDLYKSTWTGNEWSSPVNLGKNVNTAGNELFPYMGAKGSLYFSSDGHGGLGGLDIYTFNFSDSLAITPHNLGRPINSAADDFGLIFDKNSTTGFFTSNRGAEGNNDNIYYFALNRKVFRYMITGNILFDDPIRNPDMDPQSLSNVDVVVIDNKSGEQISEARSGYDGRFFIKVPYPGEFTVTVKKEQYKGFQSVIYVSGNHSLSVEYKIVLTPILTDVIDSSESRIQIGALNGNFKD